MMPEPKPWKPCCLTPIHTVIAPQLRGLHPSRTLNTKATINGYLEFDRSCQPAALAVIGSKSSNILCSVSTPHGPRLVWTLVWIYYVISCSVSDKLGLSQVCEAALVYPKETGRKDVNLCRAANAPGSYLVIGSRAATGRARNDILSH